MRASDQDREAALALLRARCAEGYLSVDTFEGRVEQTLAARTRGELRGVVADVSTGGSWLRRALARPRRRPAAAAVAVALPEGGRIIVGRSHRCDVVLEDPPVSRCPLERRPAGDGQWVAVDVGSLNGTWRHNRRVGGTLGGPRGRPWLGPPPPPPPLGG